MTYTSTGENRSLEQDAADEKSLGPKLCSLANIDEVEGALGRGKKTQLMCINAGLAAHHRKTQTMLPITAALCSDNDTNEDTSAPPRDFFPETKTEPAARNGIKSPPYTTSLALTFNDGTAHNS